ncbi:MAG: magnesium transporter [Magnetococcales bacterium]|nr:magnesium transporter [Magnetococcales bacterium]
MQVDIETGKSADSAIPSKYAEAIHRLYQMGSQARLARVVGKLLPADVAQVINSSNSLEEAMDLFELIQSPMQAGLTLKELTDDFQVHIVSSCSQDRAVAILESLAPDTRSHLIGKLSHEVGDRLMNALSQEIRKEIQDLLQYLPNTAGSLMTSRFFALEEGITARAAIQTVRSLPFHEFVFYVYVLDEEQRLTGVTSLRQLLLSPAEKPLREIMDPRVMSVNVSATQEEAANLISSSRLLALPVVNDQGVLRGIITVDDLIHVIQDVHTQSMLKASGVDADSNLSIMAQSFIKVAKGRIPWLVGPFLGGLVAAYILGKYEATMAAVIQLSFFMPMIFGMAGNVGSQTATVAVRGLATGAIQVSDFLKLLTKETLSGLLIGSFYGIALSTYAIVVFHSTTLAFVVGISILSNIVYSGVIAASLPLLLQRLGHDPAVGGGPYVLTTVDVLGVINYLIIATLVYGL